MGDVVTLLFVHFNFIIQLWNMFLFLKSIYALFIEFYYALFLFLFFKDMHYIYNDTYVLYNEKNDVHCFSLSEFADPL